MLGDGELLVADLADLLTPALTTYSWIMTMMNRRLAITTLLTFLTFATVAHADGGDCPGPVKSAIDKAFPRASITRCKAEREHGRDQFEVKVVKADGTKAEIDVTPDGKILQIEEKIGIDRVPAAVMKAFAQRYPKSTVDGAEKQTPADGPPTYELAFATDKGRTEATFKEDGTFVDEE
jgi:hypothetical protein